MYWEVWIRGAKSYYEVILEGNYLPLHCIVLMYARSYNLGVNSLLLEFTLEVWGGFVAKAHV